MEIQLPKEGCGVCNEMAMNEVKFSRDKYHLIEQMNAWLQENVGPGGWAPILDARWHIESAFGHSKYTFKDPRDAMMFALRWS